MDSMRLLDAHRSINQLLGKLALGLEKDQLNREIVSLSEHLFGSRKALDFEAGSAAQYAAS